VLNTTACPADNVIEGAFIIMLAAAFEVGVKYTAVCRLVGVPAPPAAPGMPATLIYGKALQLVDPSPILS